MKPWMGAAAVAAAMLLIPSAALAGPEDPALLKFQLPSASAEDFAKFEALGYEMNHAVDPGPNGTSIVQAWVTDEQLALVRAQGYPDVGVVHDKYNIDQIRKEIAQDVSNEAAAKLALKTNAAGVKGKSAAPATVRAQRADFYENNVGRFISVEANTTEAKVTCATPPFGNCSYTGPVLVADVYDAAGRRIGGGNLLTYIDGDPPATADYYQYHYQIFRLGNKAVPSPRRSRSPRPTATSTRSPPSSGSRRTRRATPRPSSTTSTRATTTRRRASSASRPSRPSSPTSRRPSTCRRRPGATSARRRPRSATRTRPTSRSTPATCRSAASRR
jgi:hypothetical protein